MSFEQEDLARSLNQWSAHIEGQRQQLETEVRRLKVFQHDYDALEKQLQTLPDETVRPAMASIPIGGLAFMPGKLIHTNEITVYLGADYYAERSAKQALTILNRRREVVNENLQLVEARLNGLVAKKETSYGVFPSNELGVNEEGLPIMEIREELPDEKSIQKTGEGVPIIQEAVSEKEEKPLKEDKAPVKNVWEDKEYKDLMAMLQRLEEEEEEEGEMAQNPAQENMNERGNAYSDEDEDKDEEDSEREDDEYADNLYDTEIADNLFDQFDDDEEYATQGIVDYEDATVYEEEGIEKAEGDIAKEDVEEKAPVMQAVRETQPTANIGTAYSTPTDVKDITSEVQKPSSKPNRTSRFKAAREQKRQGIQQTEDEPLSAPVVQEARSISAISDIVAELSPQVPAVEPSAPHKKLSQFKIGHQQQITKEDALNNFDQNAESTSALVDPVSNDSNRQIPVVETSAPPKKMSRFKAARQQEKDANIESSKAPVETPTNHTVQGPAPKYEPKSQILIEEPSTPQRKVSKFKLARQQQTTSDDSSRGIPAIIAAVPGMGKQTTHKEVEPSQRIAATEVSTPNKNISRFKAAGEQDRSAGRIPASPIEQQAVDYPLDKQKESTPSPDKKSKRRVTWDEVATVQEHDRYAAPADVISDTYVAPVKEGEKVYNAPQTVKSPADIFNLVQAQRQAIMDDGYPSLETGEDDFEVDMEDLGRSANLGKQEVWQLKDESKQPLIVKEIREAKESSLPVVPKTKLDTKVMRGAVIEHDIEPVDLDEVEIDMDFREVTSSYHNIRNNFVAAMGGYTFEPKDEIQVFDEELPLPSKMKGKKEDQVPEEKPKKVSRFKAARMAAFEKEQ